MQSHRGKHAISKVGKDRYVRIDIFKMFPYVWIFIILYYQVFRTPIKLVKVAKALSLSHHISSTFSDLINFQEHLTRRGHVMFHTRLPAYVSSDTLCLTTIKPITFQHVTMFLLKHEGSVAIELSKLVMTAVINI